MEDCPICYEILTNVDVCVTCCNHKFHTGCLLTNSLKCENICPICRTSLSPNVSNPKSIIPPGTYSYRELKEYIEQNNINIADTSSTMQSWFEECKEYDEKMQKNEEELQKLMELNTQRKQNEKRI